VLCTHGDDEYAEPLYATAPFNSVQTVLVPPGVAGRDIDLVAKRIGTADIVFLADGNAADYAAWASGPLGAAVRGVLDGGGVVAGSGGGAVALGTAVLTSSPTSTEALADPYAATVALAPGAFALPLLAGTVVDLDVHADDRLGRLAAATARGVADGLLDATPSSVMGIGLDAHAAIAIDRRGLATMLVDDGNGSGNAWLVRGAPADRVAKGQPLAWKSAQVTRFDAPGETFDRASACGTAFTYTVSIDGAAVPPFSPADPYEAQGVSAPCP